jgi:hypothetical protein
VWRERFAVLVLQKSFSKKGLLILYTFYSEDFRQGASNKFLVGGTIQDADVKISKKSLVFNKDHSFSIRVNTLNKTDDHRIQLACSND